jgi:hypothetical protein
MEVHGLCTWCDRLEWCRRVFLDRRIALSLHSPKMQRVPEVLQLSVVVERAGPPSFESEPSQEFNFVSGHLAAEQGILKEFSEPGFVLLRSVRQVIALRDRGTAVISALSRYPIPSR